MERKVEEFAAMGDDGRAYVVEQYVRRYRPRTRRGNARFTEESARLQTATGLAVRVLDDGRLVIESTGVGLTRTVP